MKYIICLITLIIITLLVWWFYKLSTLPTINQQKIINQSQSEIKSEPESLPSYWFGIFKYNEPSKGEEPNDLINKTLKQ